MERAEALTKIRELKGQDLYLLASQYGVTVTRNGRTNKGWAGHVIERYLGLPLNSSPSPNFGSWELKVVPLTYRKNGILRVKETMAITMLDSVEVKAKALQDSHLYLKLRKILIVSRIINQHDMTSIVHDVAEFDLDNPEILRQVTDDYNEIRNTLIKGGVLSGRMGVLIQPRTKGPGHGSTSRAFYARTQFVAKILGLAAQDD